MLASSPLLCLCQNSATNSTNPKRTSSSTSPNYGTLIGYGPGSLYDISDISDLQFKCTDDNCTGFFSIWIDGKRVFNSKKRVRSAEVNITEYKDEAIHKVEVSADNLYIYKSCQETFYITSSPKTIGTLIFNITSETTAELFGWRSLSENETEPSSIELSNYITIDGKQYELTAIGSRALSGAGTLRTITISQSIQTLGTNITDGCNSLQTIKYNATHAICKTEDENGIFTSTGTSFIIGSNVETLPDKLCKQSASLVSVSIPNSVTSIGNNTFEGCTNLKSIVIPSSVTSIGAYAFAGTGLKEVFIPKSITNMGDGILKDCKNLKKVTIKAVIDGSLGRSTFDGCNQIGEVYLFCNYGRNIPADKVFTFKSFYSGNNAIYYDEFLQRKHITKLQLGCKIDYSKRFNEFDVDGYEIKSMRAYGKLDQSVIFDNEIELRSDGKYLVKVPCEIAYSSYFAGNYYSSYYYISMTYYDPRAERDITTTIGPFSAGFHASITNLNVTQTTASFEITAPTDESTGKIAEYQLDPYEYSWDINSTQSNDGKFSFTNLRPGVEYGCYITLILEDGREFCHPQRHDFSTSDLSFSVESEIVGPTSIDLVWTYDAGDANDLLEEPSFTQSGDFMSTGHIKNNRFVYNATGLSPRSSYDITLTVPVKNQSARQQKKTFQLPELVLTTLPARATSKDCAIICAETNMSEDEIGGGFEWRRYDAPDMVPSNSVACPVANGHMEGRLNGLSSGSYYKYRPFYEDASGHKTYGEWTAFGTADVDVYFVPTVYTYTARSVGSTSATLVGYALAGSEDITEQGFEYWPEVKSRAATSEVKRVLATGQRMMATIDDLEPGMTYNVRAFAMTATETTYGELQQFETEAVDDPIKDSIETVEIAEPAVEFDIYNLQGRCVRRNATDFSGLRSGIYIANGRKIMVR